MKISSKILYSALIFSILFSPIVVNSPVVAQTSTGPVPIPGNLIPPPSLSGIPIITSTPNLGTVSTALPPISLYSISRTQSGLVASDSLTNETKTQAQLQANSGYWIYGGDAPLEKAPFDFFKDTQGLHIGVQAPAAGTWAGFYAVTPNTSAKVFHAVISTPLSTLPVTSPPTFYENGLYVQTSQPFINYVSCVSDTSQWGTVWIVGSVTGSATQGTVFHTYWVDTTPNQPLTRDCTIVTNGNNFLKVYLDGALVYSNSTLNLQMPSPFNAYLEPQSSYSGQLLNGIYKDYYTTTDENIKVVNAPILAATVKVVDPSGKVLASAPVNSGIATLTIGQFHMPLDAFIKVYDSLGNQLASTSSLVNIFGGDVYSVRSIV
jgi:hypothetical protein